MRSLWKKLVQGALHWHHLRCWSVTGCWLNSMKVSNGPRRPQSQVIEAQSHFQVLPLLRVFECPLALQNRVISSGWNLALWNGTTLQPTFPISYVTTGHFQHGVFHCGEFSCAWTLEIWFHAIKQAIKYKRALLRCQPLTLAVLHRLTLTNPWGYPASLRWYKGSSSKKFCVSYAIKGGCKIKIRENVGLSCTNQQ